MSKNLQVEKVVLYEIRMPLKEPFRTASGIETTRRILLLRLIDVDGIESWSECVAQENPNYLPETIDTAWLAIRKWLAPRVIGKRFDSAGDVHPVLESNIRGHNMAKAAVEMGFWGLAAQRQETSLAALLGGKNTEVATGVALGIEKTPEQLVANVRQALSAGYRRVKLKIAPGKDIDYIGAIRDEFGMSAPLMVDANGSYTLNDRSHLKKLDEFQLMMLEQPLAWDDLTKHAKLQSELETPICLDESVSSLSQAEEMITLGSAKILNIKAGRVGGLQPAVAIHDLCADNNIPVWCGGMLETGIGRAYNVALASLPNFVLPGDLSPSARYWQKDIATPEWKMDQEGMVTVPFERPGIGVEVDLDLIKKMTVRTDTIPNA